ncbi:MAG: permease-like cell division protein FtsX, partial [Pseudomonadota bacterium]
MKRPTGIKPKGAAPRSGRPRAATQEAQRPQKQGARSQQPRRSSRLRAWGRHHRAMAIDSLHRLIRYPLGNLLT